MDKPRFLVDFEEVLHRIPSLRFTALPNGKLQLSGDIMVMDSKGEPWEPFYCRIIFDKNYPHCIPQLFEEGGKIPHTSTRHINGDGSCCVEVEPVLLLQQQKGFTILDYIQEFAIPFLANQLLYDREGEFPTEYSHGDQGVLEYFIKVIGTNKPEVINLTFEAAITRKKYGRNTPCYCQSGKKFKKCHLKVIEEFQKLGNTYLIKYHGKMLGLLNG